MKLTQVYKSEEILRIEMGVRALQSDALGRYLFEASSLENIVEVLRKVYWKLRQIMPMDNMLSCPRGYVHLNCTCVSDITQTPTKQLASLETVEDAPSPSPGDYRVVDVLRIEMACQLVLDDALGRYIHDPQNLDRIMDVLKYGVEELQKVRPDKKGRRTVEDRAILKP